MKRNQSEVNKIIDIATLSKKNRISFIKNDNFYQLIRWEFGYRFNFFFRNELHKWFWKYCFIQFVLFQCWNKSLVSFLGKSIENNNKKTIQLVSKNWCLFIDTECMKLWYTHIHSKNTNYSLSFCLTLIIHMFHSKISIYKLIFSNQLCLHSSIWTALTIIISNKI